MLDSLLWQVHFNTVEDEMSNAAKMTEAVFEREENI